MKAIVLFSGGLDSTTCLAMVIDKYGKENVIALSLSYGQKHIKEKECARKLAKYYGVEHIEYDVSEIFKGSKCSLLQGNEAIPEGDYKSQMDGKPYVTTYVPFRNGLFLSIATSIALSEGCSEVIYGIHKDDTAESAYPDCSVEFNANMGRAIMAGTAGTVALDSPFVNATKADVVKAGLELNVPFEMTWSCYKGGEKPCGKCATCIDRQKAFEANNAVDPLIK